MNQGARRVDSKNYMVTMPLGTSDKSNSMNAKIEEGFIINTDRRMTIPQMDTVEFVKQSVLVPKNLENWHNSNNNGNSFVQKGNKFLPMQPTTFKPAKSINQMTKIRASNLQTTKSLMTDAHKRPEHFVAISTTQTNHMESATSLAGKQLANEISLATLHQQDEISSTFNMSRTFSEMSTAYQEGTPSEMFVQSARPSSPPASKQVKPFFKPAKNPVLERLQFQESLASQEIAQATGNANKSNGMSKNQF